MRTDVLYELQFTQSVHTTGEIEKNQIRKKLYNENIEIEIYDQSKMNVIVFGQGSLNIYVTVVGGRVFLFCMLLHENNLYNNLYVIVLFCIFIITKKENILLACCFM